MFAALDTVALDMVPNLAKITPNPFLAVSIIYRVGIRLHVDLEAKLAVLFFIVVLIACVTEISLYWFFEREQHF